MARPTLKLERHTQILDAFEACVPRHGMEGVTLAKTTDEAGLARPLVCHNIGNRDDLLKALVDRYLQNSRDKMTTLLDALPVAGAEDIMIARLNHQLAKEFAHADPAQVAAVATCLKGIYFNIEALYPLGDVQALLASSKQAAFTLIKSLETGDD
jgi:AcrR family transcriptional regulator